jgi:hypothetical protein
MANLIKITYFENKLLFDVYLLVKRLILVRLHKNSTVNPLALELNAWCDLQRGHNWPPPVGNVWHLSVTLHIARGYTRDAENAVTVHVHMPFI